MAQREEKDALSVCIRLYGIVQGVGYRPFVARLAQRHAATGWVRNNGGVLEIEADGTQSQLDAFKHDVLNKKPEHAIIIHSEVRDIPFVKRNSFTIEPSAHTLSPVFLPPDIAVCDDCLHEWADKKDRRFDHPFISCMSCGPRYSIIKNAPYDRATTTMNEFNMCPLCRNEYTDRQDRRCHAQTISCHDCGPFLKYREKGGKQAARQQAFSQAVSVIESGGVIAVKGVGGYHLVCKPQDDNAVKRLRDIKSREHKPFAVMFPDMQSIRDHAAVSETEETLLLSDARPIVILEKTDDFAAEACSHTVQIGAFLPYTPLQAALLNACGPLVMTSANASDEPIIKDEDEIFRFADRLDGVLYNERKIVVRLDDSVVRAAGKKTQMVRRGRGYVPLPIMVKKVDCKQTVFAAGGDLKASLCIVNAPFAYVSQYLGDLYGDSNLSVYAKQYAHMKKVFRLEPEFAVCDMHPNYASSAFAQCLNLPLLKVQHHHAHIASVMAEHGLAQPVIGIAFDGTGYGTDGAVWGGEFLICEKDRFERAGHLKYVRFVGGDETMNDAAKSAMFHMYASGHEQAIHDERWPILKAALENCVNTHESASMGRLFDAVSAMLGVCAYNRYEGECAIRLENLAAQAIKQEIRPIKMAFDIAKENGVLLADAKPVFARLLNIREHEKAAFALGFHYAVADMALCICVKLRDKYDIDAVAISGGVFQNRILLRELLEKLTAAGFSAYTNEAVPVNDGGICLGQAAIGMHHINEGKNGKCV